VAVTHEFAYRAPFGLADSDWVNFCPFGDLDAVEEVLAAGDAKSVILELVQGEEGGARPAPHGFAKALRFLCDEYGALLIVDEVQTGFGRVASGPGEWFACQRFGIVPDIMVIGKSFGGGYPVTAVVCKAHISEAMKPGYDGSTFGGNPMAMTSALIASRQMKALDLPSRVEERSAQFAEGLEAMESSSILGFRCMGLMIGVDLPGPVWVEAVQEEMAKRGAFGSLSSGATLRWMPPLVITREEVGEVLEAFAAALEVVEAKGPPVDGIWRIG
jgi:acetylornithine/succinyldiaminopimelate/putrescine aminotransferase